MYPLSDQVVELPHCNGEVHILDFFNSDCGPFCGPFVCADVCVWVCVCVRVCVYACACVCVVNSLNLA
jgi:hypothetical protein